MLYQNISVFSDILRKTLSYCYYREMKNDLEIRQLSAEQVRQMRHTVLRPHQPPEQLVYPKDDIEQTFHLGAYVDGKQVSIASFLYDDHPELRSPGFQYRIRGMATLPEYRAQGLGTKLIEVGVDIIKENISIVTEGEKRRIWCNARESAFEFYEKCGFEIVGEMFEIEGIGSHKIMWREV